MGNILWRKRPPSEELDELVLQIRELEAQLRHMLVERSGLLRWLNCLTVLVVAVLSALVWLHHGLSARARVLYAAAAWLCAGVALVALRYLVTSLYTVFIRKKRRRIALFTERKLAIIESVKETEKYNVAMELIKKYGSSSNDSDAAANGGGTNSAMSSRRNSAGGRRRGSKDDNDDASSESQQQHSAPATPKRPPPKLYELHGAAALGNASSSSLGRRHLYQQQQQQPMALAMATPSQHHRPPIRPFIEQSRTPLDRVLDFLMGESINSRYALICFNCYAHNGMALQEEFESLSFFCYKCNNFNASKNELKMHTLALTPSTSSPSIAAAAAAKGASPAALTPVAIMPVVVPFKNFVGHEEDNSDESTTTTTAENECGATITMSERRPSTISFQSEEEQQEDNNHSSAADHTKEEGNLCA